MEEEVEKCLEEVTRTPDVISAACVDENGLVLGLRGTSTNPDLNGALIALADAASGLDAANLNPVVCIDSKSSRIMVHRQGKVTCMVVKAGTQSESLPNVPSSIIAGGEGSINVD